MTVNAATAAVVAVHTFATSANLKFLRIAIENKFVQNFILDETFSVEKHVRFNLSSGEYLRSCFVSYI